MDKVCGKVSWIYQEQLIEVDCKNIVNAKLYAGQSVVLLIIEPSLSNSKLQVFSLDGTLLFEKEPPQDYSFEYLSTTKKHPSVVCDGGKSNVDNYGRSSWHFVIDTKTGDMTKGNLTY